MARGAAIAAAFPAAGAVAWWLRSPDPVTGTPTIAVLPFDAYGSDAATGRLAEGITEDIITDLTRFREFGVIARNSVETYRGKAIDIRDVGRALGVRFVLEGSIQREDDRLRVTAQLVDARNDAHIWSQRWDRPAKDLFDVQADLSRQVAGQLGGIAGVIADSDRTAARRKPPSDLGAYDLYVLAAEGKQKETRQSIEEAIALLNRSLAIDPTFARAWALLGSCYAIMLRWTDDWNGTYALYVGHFRHAVDLDPMDADAHAGLAYALGLGGDLRQAEVEFEKALQLNPNSTDVLTRYGSFAAGFERPTDGAAMADLAGRLDPNPSPWAARFRSYALFGGGRFAEAVRVRERVPKEMFAEADYIELAIFLAAAGRTQEAVALAREANGPFPTISIEGWTGTPDYSDAERKELVAYMRQAGFRPCADPAEIDKGRIRHRLPECGKS
ncbi:MAG: hypothetical protein INR68_16905 [Methylobacterium mesophilicum]|nr:hypothetical protein [Methylobacterium mesophilicum]